MRLIDADKLLEEIEDWHDSLGGTMNPADWGIQNVLQSVMDSIIEASTIDAEPVRHGRWGVAEIVGYDGYHAVYAYPCNKCCEYTREHKPRFCPHCGAKMDGGTDNARNSVPWQATGQG